MDYSLSEGARMSEMSGDSLFGPSAANSFIFGAAFSTFFITTLLITFIIAHIILALCLMPFFKKAGISVGKAWIPFYNMWIFYELGGYQGYLSLVLSLLSWVPFVNYLSGFASFILFVLVLHEINKKLSRGVPSTILGIFFFPILAIGVATQKVFWNDSLGKPSLAKGTIVGYRKVSENPINPNQE